MKLLSRQESEHLAFERGSWSGHFLWALNEMPCRQSEQGWVFALQENADAVLVLFDPLPGDGSFSRALNELQAFAAGRVLSFVGISRALRDTLESLGAQSLAVAHEPWVVLADYAMSGKSAKGARAGRNQALRAGVRIEEWTAQIRAADPLKTAQLREIWREWSERNIVELVGFATKVDPFLLKHERRYFVAVCAAAAEALLVVSPIRRQAKYYFEDILLARESKKGVAELLVTEALLRLKADGGEVSLGAVASFPKGDLRRLSYALRALVAALHFFSQLFYPLSGLDLFRRRFRPQRWDQLYWSILPRAEGAPAWGAAWRSLAEGFRVKISLRPARWFSAAKAVLRRKPVLWSWLIATSFCFVCINHFGRLGETSLAKFAFSPKFPLQEWAYRSIMCDVLTYSPLHYFVSLAIGIPLLSRFDKETRLPFRLWMVGLLVLGDDFLNYLFIKPFEVLQPHVFHAILLSTEPAIGNSLVFVCIFGFLAAMKERFSGWLVPVLLLPVLLVSLYSSGHYHFFVLRINYLLFFLIGLLLGQFYRYVERKESRRVAALRAPSHA